MPAFQDASITIAPGTFQAVIAVPVTVIRVAEARFAERTLLENPICRARGCGRRRVGGGNELPWHEEVGIIDRPRGICDLCGFLPAIDSNKTEAEPVMASLALAIAI